MYTIVSLFAGAGGLDLGFLGGFSVIGKSYERTKFDIVKAYEWNEQAVEVYRQNIGEHIRQADVRDVDFLETSTAVDVVIGGFPCQDFSISGKRQHLTVERGKLYLEFRRAIATLKPKYFVAENVKNLANILDGQVLQTIVSDFEDAGYRVQHRVLHGADFGVPQNRERVIIIGTRADIPVTASYPSPLLSSHDWVTAKDAIDDLWGEESHGRHLNHSTYSKAKFRENNRSQGNRRIHPDKVAPTIRSEHHGNIEGHYRTNGDPSDLSTWRRLTPRECARLQTFPDDFAFSMQQTHSYRQIGNAVPPVLGWHVAKSIEQALDTYHEQKEDRSSH